MINPDWTLAVAAAVFLVTLLALNRLLFKPLFKILDERKARTEDLRLKTEEMLKRQRALLERYQGQVGHEKQKGYRSADAARSAALNERQVRLADARSAAASLTLRSREEIDAEIVTAQEALKRDSQEIARMIAARVLNRS